MGVLVAQNRPSVSAFPDSTVGSACTSTFSRFARRLLALRPAHSRGHQIRDRYPGASDISSPPCLLRLLPAGAVAGWASHPLESAALSRRTWTAVLRWIAGERRSCAETGRSSIAMILAGFDPERTLASRLLLPKDRGLGCNGC